MEGIYQLKERFEKVYSRWGNYLDALARFAAALLLFQQIAAGMGGACSIFLVLILALFCSFLPANVTAVCAVLLLMMQLYQLSLAALVTGGSILLLLLLVYFAFVKTQGYALMLTPLALALHMPCSIPLAFGLLGKPLAGGAIAVGTAGYYAMAAIKDAAGANVQLAMAEAAGREAILDEIKGMLDAILQEQEMVLMLIALLAAFLVVYFARRMAMNYAWTVAIAAGALIYTILMAAGGLMLTMRTGFLWTLIGIVLSVAAAVVLQLFFFDLDYSKTEKLQFEDDRYYYYVQAVPKKHSAKKRKEMNRKGCE